MKGNSYFDMVEKYFHAKESAVKCMENHPRMQKMALVELEYEKALFGELEHFEDKIVCDVITSTFGEPEPSVVLSHIRNFAEVRQNFLVYCCSLFEDDNIRMGCFYVTFSSNSKRSSQYLIYPFEKDEDIKKIREDLVRDLNDKDIVLYPMFIREPHTFKWLRYGINSAENGSVNR